MLQLTIRLLSVITIILFIVHFLIKTEVLYPYLLVLVCILLPLNALQLHKNDQKKWALWFTVFTIIFIIYTLSYVF